ncbi:unnamed protein product [Clonostachys rosea]|uniref:Transcription factor domain-containing protein n=1 Tax=Bionectria ochroleuca TaxID=29856 RepID=A0ABY6UGF0_BIOOC|nr:unnamed protein product [Clonostachys rosea]
MLPGGWLRSLPSTFHYRDQTLDRSLLALYAGFVSKREQDPRLAKISVECYIKSLHTLRNSDVWVKKTPSTAEINTTLATVLVLSRVELMSGEDGSGGYVAHIRAGLQLLKRLPPSISCDNELTWMLAKRLRCLGFYNAARQRRSFFMAQSPFDEWCFARPEEPDYLLQRAIDIAIGMPTIMEKADALDASAPMSENDLRRCLRAAKHLLEQAFDVTENLEQWLLETREARLSSSIMQARDYASSGGVGGSRAENSPPYFDPSSYSLLISWYFCLRIYLFFLVKQLRTRHDTFSKLLANPPRLPLHLRTFEQNCATVDRYAWSIRRSVTTALTASAFEAQEALVLIFTLYRYWKEKGDDHNALCCIYWLEEIKSQGLAVDVEVDERYAVVTARFMGEHQSVAK